MKTKRSLLQITILATIAAHADGSPKSIASTHPRPSPRSLWQHPGDIASRDLKEGPPVKPTGPFRFVESVSSGSTPKFKVKDSRGSTWIVKLGEEARSETAAARLLWAIGYHVDDDYYLPQIRVANLPKLPHASKYIANQTVYSALVRGARLERMEKARQYTGDWSWQNNPHTGTRELNGLRVMMALLNNWDLKKSNNNVFHRSQQAPTYQVADIGATFGKTGHQFTRSKSNLEDYENSRFIQRINPETVDFHMNSRPFFLTAIHLPHYITRTKMQGIAKDIPITHAKWVGNLLNQLSNQQLRDCFVSSGYSRTEAKRYAQLVRARITQLVEL